MIKSKNSIFILFNLMFFLIFEKNSVLAQEKNSKINNSTEKTYNIYINCDGNPDSLLIPEIIGYEKTGYNCFKKKYISIYYNSSHVARIDAIIEFRKSRPYVKGIMLYAPCQTCSNSEVYLYKLYCNKSLSYFYNVNMLNYIEKKRNMHKYKRINYKYVLEKFENSFVK